MSSVILSLLQIFFENGAAEPFDLVAYFLFRVPETVSALVVETVPVVMLKAVLVLEY